MKNLKTLLGIGMIIGGLAIIGIIYTVYTKNPSSTNNGNTNTVIQNSNAAAEDNTNVQSASKTYSTKDLGITFQTTAPIEPGMSDFTYLPYDNEQVRSGNYYSHEAKSEYCAPSGECQPTTTDISFNVSETHDSLATIKAKLPDAKTVTLGKYSVLTFSQGVEGEGVNYYFITMPDGHTLMFDQRYIDESINTKYKTVKDFIPFAKQNQIMRDIISSLVFNK